MKGLDCCSFLGKAFTSLLETQTYVLLLPYSLIIVSICDLLVLMGQLIAVLESMSPVQSLKNLNAKLINDEHKGINSHRLLYDGRTQSLSNFFRYTFYFVDSYRFRY